MTDMNDMILRIKKHLRVTKVVCTRSVKGPRGDHYVGFSAVWDSLQDDAGGASDLITPQGEGGTRIAQSQVGMTLKEARASALMVSLQAEIAAHDHAVAGGNMDPQYKEEAVKQITRNYAQLLAALMGETNVRE